MIKAVKGKVADIFAEDEDEEQTEKPTKIERKVEIKVGLHIFEMVFFCITQLRYLFR